MKPVNLEELRAGFKGTRFRQLIQHHLDRQSQEERVRGISGAIAMLPGGAVARAEEFIDCWNARAYDETLMAEGHSFGV